MVREWVREDHVTRDLDRDNPLQNVVQIADLILEQLLSPPTTTITAIAMPNSSLFIKDRLATPSS